MTTRHQRPGRRLLLAWLLVAMATAAAAAPATGGAGRQAERDRMLDVIRRYGMTDEAVLRAMGAVPRHEFVPPERAAAAYDDTPLPIGHGQTISQPYMVAEMTRQLRVTPDARVLEIGTGSGYQAAILAEMGAQVFSVELVEPLALEAIARLKRLGYDRVAVRVGDGWEGWAEHAPYDAIIVTCAAETLPPALLRQLAPGGRMIIPVGPQFTPQSLMLVEKDADGRVSTRSLMAVRFVPFVTDRSATEPPR